MGASVRGLRMSGSVDAIVDYVGRQTLPDTGINPEGDGIVGYYDAGLSRWEPVGHWGGRQADAEGLDQVRRVELARMVSGLDPSTGLPLGHLPRQGAVVAWDLTFTTALERDRHDTPVLDHATTLATADRRLVHEQPSHAPTAPTRSR